MINKNRSSRCFRLVTVSIVPVGSSHRSSRQCNAIDSMDRVSTSSSRRTAGPIKWHQPRLMHATAEQAVSCRSVCTRLRDRMLTLPPLPLLLLQPISIWTIRTQSRNLTVLLTRMQVAMSACQPSAHQTPHQPKQPSSKGSKSMRL